MAHSRYRFRNLPANIAPDDKLWCVSGYDNAEGFGGGILEWCYNKEDARNVLAQMVSYPQFSKLRIHKYQVIG